MGFPEKKRTGIDLDAVANMMGAGYGEERR
jgi:hypothetical protein